MDRALGYGLKYPTGFKKTHLGWQGACVGAHAKTSDRDICQAVRHLLESGGEAAFPCKLSPRQSASVRHPFISAL